jgi:hypothetical protein
LSDQTPQPFHPNILDKGAKLSILLLQLRKRLYGPLGFGLFRSRPSPDFIPDSRFEKTYLKVEKAVDETIALMAAQLQNLRENLTGFKNQESNFPRWIS